MKNSVNKINGIALDGWHLANVRTHDWFLWHASETRTCFSENLSLFLCVLIIIMCTVRRRNSAYFRYFCCFEYHLLRKWNYRLQKLVRYVQLYSGFNGLSILGDLKQFSCSPPCTSFRYSNTKQKNSVCDSMNSF